MSEPQRILLSLTAIFVMGLASQWAAARLRIPSILLLLGCGLLVGPIAGWIDPDELFGDLLFPMVSLSVAIVLFEGSLGLKLSELKEIAVPLRNLLTLGVFVSWVLGTIAAWRILQFPITTSLLLGALLTVTGPTVVGPLLRHVRPIGRIGAIAKWEGIVVDPIGAVLAVLVLETILPLRSAEFGDAIGDMLQGLVLTAGVGTLIGVVSAWALAQALRRHWISDHLQSPVTLMFVFAAFTGSNLLRHESGLVSVTVMGVVLANLRGVIVHHIVEFKETLTVVLVSVLFILLASRIELESLRLLSWRGPLFVAALILIVRPVSVYFSTIGVGLTIQERIFLAWLAPRGIVAAAVAAIFALELNDPKIVPATFMVITGTVVVYGLTAFPLARFLGLATRSPQGVLIAGAGSAAQAIAKVIQEAGFRTFLVDTARDNIRQARMKGLSTSHANILSEHIVEDLDLGGIGYFLAMTPNDEVNSLSSLRMAELFSRSGVFQIASPAPTKTLESKKQDQERHERPEPRQFRGRNAFANDLTLRELDDRLRGGWTIKATPLTPEFEIADFRREHGEAAVLLFLVTTSDQLVVLSPDKPVQPQPGQTVIALVPDSPSTGTDEPSEVTDTER